MDKDQTESANAPNLVARPYEIIQSLPPRYRWEFTRRHPYYVMCWNNVDPDVAPSSSEHPGENELRLRMAQFAKLAQAGRTVPRQAEISTAADGPVCEAGTLHDRFYGDSSSSRERLGRIGLRCVGGHLDERCFGTRSIGSAGCHAGEDSPKRGEKRVRRGL